MPDATEPEHPGAVRTAAGVRIAGIADLGTTIEPAPVRRPGRHRERENHLGGDHEAGGDATERGHDGERMVSVPGVPRLHSAAKRERFPGRGSDAAAAIAPPPRPELTR